MNQIHRITALSVVTACLLPACGGGGDAAPTTTRSAAATAGTPETTAEPTTEPPSDATTTVAAPSSASTATVPESATSHSTVTPSTGPPSTVATFLDAAIRPASFPGPIEPGKHRFWTVEPPIEITFGDGWSAGWELGDQTLAPNYTAAFEHALSDGYVRLALWSMTGDDVRVAGDFRTDLRDFLREHPDVDQLTEHEVRLEDGWSATQFDFSVAGEASNWIPLQVLGEPISELGLYVGDGFPQHWTVIDNDLDWVPAELRQSTQLLVTWEVDGIDRSDARALAAASDEAAELVGPVVASIVASHVPYVGQALRFDWMSGGREVTPEAEIAITDAALWRPTATDDAIVVSTEDGIYVVDPDDNTVRRTDTEYVGAGFGVTYGAGALWMPDFPGSSVHRLDPVTLAETAEIEVGINPSMVSVTGGFVWTADHRGGTVSKIDPGTNERVGQYAVSGPGRGGPYGPVADGESVWVPVPQFDQITRIDAATGAIEANVMLPAPSTDPVIVGDRLFASAAGNDLVHVVDTNTNEPITSVPLGAYPTAVIDIDGTPWVIASIGETQESWLVAIDPDTLEIADQVRIPFPATDALDAFGSIWVSGRSGTLTRYPREAFTG